MKPNEWVLTIVQIAAPVYAFNIGNKPMGIFLTLWLVAFGIAEGISKWKTGGTLSQNVWKQPKHRRIILSLIFCLWWRCSMKKLFLIITGLVGLSLAGLGGFVLYMMFQLQSCSR
jgi:hypothetical protein